MSDYDPISLDDFELLIKGLYKEFIKSKSNAKTHREHFNVSDDSLFFYNNQGPGSVHLFKRSRGSGWLIVIQNTKANSLVEKKDLRFDSIRFWNFKAADRYASLDKLIKEMFVDDNISELKNLMHNVVPSIKEVEAEQVTETAEKFLLKDK